ncbi:hypothetical protein V5799_019302, partial [Amblyomma americanum]
MGNQPGVARMDTSAPDGKPSTSRRKSTEKEQRLSVGASSDPQESLIAARAILSDIVNHVVSERSPRPTEASADNGNSVLNRTLSSRSLKSYLLAGQCVPDEDCANRTFPLEADPEGSERPSPTSANAGSSGPADTGVVTEPSGSARADNALRPCTSEASAEASPCVLLSPENRSSDAHPVASRSATPVDTDQGGSASDSVSEPPSSDCWYYTDASDASLPGVGANKSELDLTYTTAKGSPLGAARFFDTSSLHTSNVAPSECHPDKGTTEGTLPVDSEAGPEVAQFSEEEHRAAAVYFKEDLDFLQKVGSSQRLGRTSLGRCSLFLNFDPLLANSPTN